ncbi:MAG: bifunctional hydroxymethylpyrimidine kinase/phosphomethylpyrimidine kinase, partial [Myxococcales bacterium]|nr:bifunctional hydroxymethylpyrimidine kinase/phosphomethylpyrimidine kinase [Myxococcales bacterium]
MSEPSGLTTLLSVAGTSPTSGAGLQADLQVFRDFGFHGASLPTVVLSQSSSTVFDRFSLPVPHVRASLDSTLRGLQPRAIKVGLLGSGKLAEAISPALRDVDVPVVVDPVLASGLGHALSDQPLITAYARGMAHSSLMLTPNVPEAQALTGLAIDSLTDMREAAEFLVAAG